jgi:hypothetical protein
MNPSELGTAHGKTKQISPCLTCISGIEKPELSKVLQKYLASKAGNLAKFQASPVLYPNELTSPAGPAMSEKCQEQA